MMLKSMAVQNELTSNPSTKLSQSKIMTALMTNKNKPNVKKVTGKVNNTNMGFTKKFNNPRTMATVKAVENSSIITPFISLDMTKAKMAVISILKSSFMVLF
jgi:hypothetical protein